MTSTEKNAKDWKGRAGYVLRVVAALGVLCVLLAAVESGSTPTRSLRVVASERGVPSPSSAFGSDDGTSDRQAPITLQNEQHNHRSSARSSLTTPQTSGTPPASPRVSRAKSQRRLPGGYPEFGGAATGGAALLVVLLVLLFCCRGMLCDLLACACLYEMCCDDGAIGGFDLMPC